MENYEITFLLIPELNEEELEKCVEKIEALINENGKTAKKETPKKITLSYAIQKYSQAFLFALEFEQEKNNIKKTIEKIKEIKEIIRFLLIKKSKASEKKPLIKSVKKESKTIKTENKKQESDMKQIEKDLEELL